MLKQGDAAPDFELPDQDGNLVSLAPLLAKGPLLLYFYPADFTPGCTKEACSFRDMHSELTNEGLQIFGVSPQNSASHERFRSRYQLPFTLLADPDKRVIRAYGCDGPLGIGVRRRTFHIDAHGIIRNIVTADFFIQRHVNFALDAAHKKEGQS